ncbi:hypothetical protein PAPPERLAPAPP_04590 [Brevundimonas phage vB_BpoS-Papperlapapp]|uniref:Uncharacterized protein n=2 Tax=Marchewkavirus TaxID=3425052 RepID=A0A9E7MPB3_9CAUD|nr:hypothetical protein KABACHOK_02970 [Brevundimonas phage vB_BpoS-Kabachok]USN14828.1 hypothetical protein DOMOVOI_03540 [Brevundimonas phage vB_BpoS-Domovoi]USN16200.1 hypothetical protein PAPPERLAPAPP_04590 [Brevundimonas phage vB_BpoS-Papperlapapp]
MNGPPEPPPMQVVERGLIEPWAIWPLMILISLSIALILFGLVLG